MLPRTAYDDVDLAFLDALNDGLTHIYVVERDGTVTDTEAPLTP